MQPDGGDMRPPDEPSTGRGADTHEFDAFYAESVGRLIGHLYAMTGDLAEAQDVVQEAFARAWERRTELDLNGAPEAWVRTVAWRLAVSRWRKVRTALAFARRQGPPAAVPPRNRTTCCWSRRCGGYPRRNDGPWCSTTCAT